MNIQCSNAKCRKTGKKPIQVRDAEDPDKVLVLCGGRCHNEVVGTDDYPERPVISNLSQTENRR